MTMSDFFVTPGEGNSILLAESWPTGDPKAVIDEIGEAERSANGKFITSHGNKIVLH